MTSLLPFAPRQVRTHNSRLVNPHRSVKVQHKFGGMRDAGWGIKSRRGMGSKKFEGGMRDEYSLAGSGCVHFNWWDAG